MPSHLLGADDIDVSVVEKRVDGTSSTTIYPMCAYYYKLDYSNGELVLPVRDSLNYYTVSSEQISSPLVLKLPQIFSSNSVSSGDIAKDIVFMLYTSKVSGSGNLKLKCTNCTISTYNSETYTNISSSSSTEVEIKSSGMCVFKVSVSEGSIPSITFSSVSVGGKAFNGSFTLSTCDVINSKFNKDLGLEDFALATEISTIENDLLTTLRGKGFYYNYKPEKTKLIELDSNTTPKFDMLSPYILYDFNNVANKFTLSEIDFSTSKIDVVRSSRL